MIRMSLIIVTNRSLRGEPAQVVIPRGHFWRQTTHAACVPKSSREEDLIMFCPKRVIWVS